MVNRPEGLLQRAEEGKQFTKLLVKQFSRFSSFLGLSIQEAKSEIFGLICSCGVQSRDGITKEKNCKPKLTLN
jgi:hypothetical protein